MQVLLNVISAFSPKLVVFSLLTGSLLMSCEDGGLEGSTPSPTLPTEIREQTELTLFYQALQQDSTNTATSSVLSRLYNRRVAYTVFAPNNEALTNWLQANSYTDLAAIPAPELNEFLLGHVVQNLLASRSFSAGIVTSLNGQDLNIRRIEEGEEVSYTFNGQAVTETDISARNGLIHITSGVLEYPTVTRTLSEQLVIRAEFSALAEQLARPALDSLLDSLQNPGGNFTLLAPTNTAISNFLAANNLTSLNEVADEDLANLVANHILPGSYSITLAPGTYATLGDAEVEVTEENGIFKINGVSPTEEITARNGTILSLPEVLSF